MAKLANLFVLLLIMSYNLGLVKIHRSKNNIKKIQNNLIYVPTNHTPNVQDQSPSSPPILVELIYQNVKSNRNTLEGQNNTYSIGKGMSYVIGYQKK